MEVLVLGLFLALLSGAINMATNNISDQNQRDAAREADKRQLENQKELIDYQIQKQEDTNTISTQKGHAASAGYNPALMYSGSLPSLLDTSAPSAQGTMPQLGKMLPRIDSGTLTDLAIQKGQQDLMSRRVNVEEQVGKAQFLKDMSQAAENMRNTKFQKRMENVIYNQGMLQLDMMSAQKHGIDIQNLRSQLLLPGELANQGLINEQIATQIKDTTERMKNYPVERARMQADTQYILRGIEHYDHIDALTDGQLAEVQERYRGSVVERVMQEFGLSARKFRGPGNLVDKANMFLGDKRYLGAVAQLVDLGFSQEEAVSTVLYYVAADPKDVSPSAVNAISRGISALILKK